MTGIPIKEPLYLCKEDFLTLACPMNSFPLAQHQKDGIRFLFAMFKKKKPGVILNDPPGYGKTMQVVCFLNAIRSALKGPVLVLVKENEVSLWKDHFERHSNFGDDIVYEPTNPFAKKAVFVSSRQGELLARRPWAVAVLDGHAARPPADYKICLRADDLKENLYNLASYYNYLYPKECFEAAEFTPDKGDPKDVVSKALLLDGFLDEILLRRTGFTPFQKPQTHSPLANEPPRVSRKNKDATGTKIKRSRPRVEPEPTPPPKVPRIDPPLKNSTITSKDYYRNEMDVESFIKNEKPIEHKNYMNNFAKLFTTVQSDGDEYKNEIDKDQVKVNGDKVNESECTSEVNTADYQDAINDIIRNENNSDKNESVENDSIKVEGDDFAVSNDKDSNVTVKEQTEETIHDVVNNGSKNDLESKIKDLEEKALNKFKGSLLDSIF